MTPEEKLFDENKHIAKETLYRMFIDIKGITRQHNIEFDDLLQYSYTGLWIGVLKFNPQKSKLKTHLINHVRWHVLERLHRECNIMKLHSNEKRENINMYKFISMDESMDDEDDGNIYHELIPSDTDSESESISNIVSKYIWNTLSDREREIIEHKEKGFNNREIGDKFNLTRSMIGHVVRELRKKLNNLEVETV